MRDRAALARGKAIGEDRRAPSHAGQTRDSIERLHPQSVVAVAHPPRYPG
jgi:hypothetical protein